MGRRPKYTDEQFISALREARGMVYLAARSVGCDPSTIYERASKRRAVRRAIKNERGAVVDAAEQKLFCAIEAGEPWAIQLCLKTLGRDRGYVEGREGQGADVNVLVLGGIDLAAVTGRKAGLHVHVPNEEAG